MLKSSAEKLGVNKARHLSKSIQNPEILINNMSVNKDLLFYKHFLYEKNIIFLIDTENFNAKL